MQTCCQQQHDTAGYSDDQRNVTHAECLPSVADAHGSDDNRLLGKTQHHMHAQPDRPVSDNLSSGTSVKLQEHNELVVLSWQRTRSFFMVVLGLVVRLCLSSAVLSRFVQVNSLILCQPNLSVLKYKRTE